MNSLMVRPPFGVRCHMQLVIPIRHCQLQNRMFLFVGSVECHKHQSACGRGEFVLGI